MTNSFSNVQRYFFVGLLAAVTVLFLWMLRSYLITIIWAVVFAILLYPVFEFVQKRLRNRNISAGLTILFSIVLVFVPLFIIGVFLADDAVSIYQNVAVSAPTYINAVGDNYYIQSALDFFDLNIEEIENMIIDFARTSSAWLASQILSVGAKTFSTIIKIFITLYLLFFLLKDGEKIMSQLGKTITLGGGREKELFNKFSMTVKAIFNGTIVISIIQGIMGGVLFLVLDINNAVLWGSIMAFLSIIPSVGPSFVLIPTAIVLFAMGSPLSALIVVAGSIFIGLTDNLLKPIFLGKSAKMPDALILISIFGGIVTFGIAGAIIGPVIAALFLSFWKLFAEEYKGQLHS